MKQSKVATKSVSLNPPRCSTGKIKCLKDRKCPQGCRLPAPRWTADDLEGPGASVHQVCSSFLPALKLNVKVQWWCFSADMELCSFSGQHWLLWTAADVSGETSALHPTEQRMGKVQLTHSYETFLRSRTWVRIPGDGLEEISILCFQFVFLRIERQVWSFLLVAFFLLPEAGMLFTGVGQCLRNAASVAGKWFQSPEGSSQAKLQTRRGFGGQGCREEVHLLKKKKSNKQTDKSCRDLI